MKNERTTAGNWAQVGITGAALCCMLLLPALAGAQSGVGGTCKTNSDCSPTTSNNCVDGICCDPTCSGKCSSCAQATTGQPNGTCAQVLANQQTTNGCNTAGEACNNGACVPTHCLNGTKDGDETDVDCGGPSCPSCSRGNTCNTGTDCVGNNCVDGICCASSCFQPCYSCALAVTGQPNGDCHLVQNNQQTTNSCNGAGQACSNGACVPTHCFNGIKDGDETDVDCGGSCPGCGVANTCNTNNDCLVGNCIDGVCCDRACFGTCRSCALATTGQLNGTCAQVLSGQQTTNGCNTAGQACSGGACVSNHCFNGIKDGDETDVDCGGSCSGCAVPKACNVSSDCLGNNCVDGICCDPVCYQTCHSCAQATTGQPNGTCAQVLTGQQTTNGCAAAGAMCDDLGMCLNPNALTPTATATVAPGVTPTTTGTVTPRPCTGDCDGGGTVTVDELLKGVNIALGAAILSECTAFDCNGNGQVTVDCIVAAVDAALNGCPPAH